MMNNLCSYFLVFTLLLPAFYIPVSEAQTTKVFNPSKDCAEGKCVDRYVGLLEAKIKQANKEHCLPPAGTKNQSEWFQNKALSVDCFRQIKEIEELHDKLLKVQSYLSDLDEKGGCADCEKNKTPVNDILGNLKDIETANAQLSCSPQRKKEIMNKCGADATCVLVSSSLTVLGPAANLVIPSSLKSKGCNSNDSCLTHLATGFVKAVFGLFEGLWDALKFAKKGVKNLWNWVTEAENKSSTSQHAAAKASADEGVFRQLVNDFGGTMSKIWSGFLASMKEWLSGNVFCQEWSGIPQFSTCKRPAAGIDCTECKAMITGLCSITGTIVSEVVPAFLTGGLVTCAKYGAQGASKVAKLFKVSAATTKAIKSSKLARSATKASMALSKTGGVAKITNTVTKALKLSLTTLRAFMIKPLVKGATVSISAMKSAAKASKVYVMATPAGHVITFGTKVAKTAGKVVIFPFENALTVKAFQLGEKTFEKIITKAGGKVVNAPRPALAGETARAMSVIDDAYKEAKVAKASGNQKLITEAGDKYLQSVRAQRALVIDEYLKSSPGIKFDNLIDEFYPELRYGKTKLSSAEIAKAESELFEAISKAPDAKTREALALAYQEHVASTARKANVSEVTSFTKEEVYNNASLSVDSKADKALEITDKSLDKKTIVKALQESENVGSGGVFKYSSEDLTKQRKILTDYGFTEKEADELIKAGIAGKVSVEDSFTSLRSIPLPKKQGLVEEMSKTPEYGSIIVSKSVERRPAMARALKVLEDGETSASAAKTFKRFEKNFDHVQNLGGAESDAASLLAEYVRRQKKAGLTDDVIQKKIDKAFGACK